MMPEFAICLTPEEDSIADPDEQDDDIDDLMPADLWFRVLHTRHQRAQPITKGSQYAN